MLKLWKWYQNCLAVHPVKTQVISSGLIWGFGDIAAQAVTQCTAKSHHLIEVYILPPSGQVPLNFSYIIWFYSSFGQMWWLLWAFGWLMLMREFRSWDIGLEGDPNCNALFGASGRHGKAEKRLKLNSFDSLTMKFAKYCIRCKCDCDCGNFEINVTLTLWLWKLLTGGLCFHICGL